MMPSGVDPTEPGAPVTTRADRRAHVARAWFRSCRGRRRCPPRRQRLARHDPNPVRRRETSAHGQLAAATGSRLATPDRVRPPVHKHAITDGPPGYTATLFGSVTLDESVAAPVTSR